MSRKGDLRFQFFYDEARKLDNQAIGHDRIQVCLRRQSADKIQAYFITLCKSSKSHHYFIQFSARTLKSDLVRINCLKMAQYYYSMPKEQGKYLYCL